MSGVPALAPPTHTFKSQKPRPKPTPTTLPPPTEMESEKKPNFGGVEPDRRSIRDVESMEAAKKGPLFNTVPQPGVEQPVGVNSALVVPVPKPAQPPGQPPPQSYEAHATSSSKPQSQQKPQVNPLGNAKEAALQKAAAALSLEEPTSAPTKPKAQEDSKPAPPAVPQTALSPENYNLLTRALAEVRRENELLNERMAHFLTFTSPSAKYDYSSNSAAPTGAGRSVFCTSSGSELQTLPVEVLAARVRQLELSLQWECAQREKAERKVTAQRTALERLVAQFHGETPEY